MSEDTSSGQPQDVDRLAEHPAAQGHPQSRALLSRASCDQGVLYLAIRHLIEPKAGDRNQVAPGWKRALSDLILYFGDRITIR